MRIFILGSKGTLGSYCYRYFKSQLHEVVGLNRPSFDVLRSDTHAFIQQLQPRDVIINCTGILKPNLYKYTTEQVEEINYKFTNTLAVICKAKGVTFFHICSDCIYSGSKGNYTEDDTADACDLYASTKSKVNYHDLTAIRTSFIGANYNSAGLLDWLIRNRNKHITGYSNCLWNGVTCLDICKSINSIIPSPYFGVRHLFSDKRISKYELLVILNNAYKLNCNISEVLATEISGTIIDNILDRSLASKYDIFNRVVLQDSVYEQQKFDEKYPHIL